MRTEMTLSKRCDPCYNACMEERFLPIGIQDFEDLRTRGYTYVDKTDLLYELARCKSPYFLSRPRRFGKSLLLSTLEAYFSGKKELFKGLAIESLEGEWTEYPIIKFSFGANSYEDNERLKERINSILAQYEKDYPPERKIADASERFGNLIRTAYERTGKQVVILIDEYDKPILDALYTEFEDKNREVLRSFYSPLKDSDKYIRFLFLTGITKVSYVNIFSGLNQLNDISLNSAYASICGISEKELDEYFEPEINRLAAAQKMTPDEARAKLALMYDGYHFAPDSEGVYNPFCLFKCFYEDRFGSFWFESGTPTFLVKTLQNRPFELSNLVNGRVATEDQFKNYDPESMNLLPVVYQSGYLTIKSYDREDESFLLDFPNREVEKCFLEVLLQKFVSFPNDDMGLEVNNLRRALRNKEIDKVLSIIKAAIADLPTIVKKDMCENYYESVTHLIFRLSGYRVASELQSVAGRSDVIVAAKDAVYIFELKMDRGRDFDDVAAEALLQIDENGYSDRFAVSGKELFKIGVVFSSEGKGMVGWKVK